MDGGIVLYMLLFAIVMLISLILLTLWAAVAFVMHYVRKAKHFAHKYLGIAEAMTGGGVNFVIISSKKHKRKTGWS